MLFTLQQGYLIILLEIFLKFATPTLGNQENHSYDFIVPRAKKILVCSETI